MLLMTCHFSVWITDLQLLGQLSADVTTHHFYNDARAKE